MSEIKVATSGTIERDDRCASCQEPTLYAVDAAGRVHDSFCGHMGCPAFLMEIPE